MNFSLIDTFEDPATKEIFEITQILEYKLYNGDPSCEAMTYLYVLSGNHATVRELFHYELIQLINSDNLIATKGKQNVKK
jgi:hypothetical protein